ncbi:MAG: flagellar hook-basal body complex protein FliE [Acidobacteria bacterium]|jgi:flagellar hook-basal body complex protein FliE|nr:MAG: flagellar hook-basal body complex protein FliE [Acidobacteriota bacterium]
MSNPVSSLRILPVDIEPIAPRSPQKSTQFMDTLKEAMNEVENVQGQAESKVSELLQGNGMDVHSAMIAVEKAELSFQLMMQVRNKIVQAYQEIARLQF